MRVAVRSLPTFSADVGSNFIHSPEPTRDNMRETRELFSQIPRFHSAPTPLTSQVSIILLSCGVQIFFLESLRSNYFFCIRVQVFATQFLLGSTVSLCTLD